MNQVKRILSLGAGVQSSTIFLMSCYGEMEKVAHAIFADTGWEPKAVYRWLDFLREEGKRHGIEIHTVQQGNIRDDALISQVRGKKSTGHRWASMPYFTLAPDGSRGMIRRQCTYEYKIRPIQKTARLLAGYRPRQRIPTGEIEIWKGISMDEIKRASMSSVSWIEFYYPLIELKMTRRDCLRWFTQRNLPRPPRSSCIGCPFHHNDEWRAMRDQRPEEFQEAIEFDRAIRKCGGIRGDMFLHAERIPLDEVDLSNDEDKGQGNLFLEECQGVCGV